MSWQAIAQENFEAASAMREAGSWRSCVSRSYYAAFAVLTHRLIGAGLTPRPQFGTWAHSVLPDLIRLHLVSSSVAATHNLAAAIERLYRLRLVADYRPELSVGKREAHSATGLMNQAFRGLT